MGRLPLALRRVPAASSRAVNSPLSHPGPDPPRSHAPHTLRHTRQQPKSPPARPHTPYSPSSGVGFCLLSSSVCHSAATSRCSSATMPCRSSGVRSDLGAESFEVLQIPPGTTGVSDLFVGWVGQAGYRQHTARQQHVCSPKPPLCVSRCLLVHSRRPQAASAGACSARMVAEGRGSPHHPWIPGRHSCEP